MVSLPARRADRLSLSPGAVLNLSSHRNHTQQLLKRSQTRRVHEHRIGIGGGEPPSLDMRRVVQEGSLYFNDISHLFVCRDLSSFLTRKARTLVVPTINRMDAWNTTVWNGVLSVRFT